MSVADMVCYITVGQAAEDMRDYAELESAFEQSFDDLADGFFSGVADNIIEAIRSASDNPLCIVLVSCILVVLAFHLVPSIFRIFGGRG